MRRLWIVLALLTLLLAGCTKNVTAGPGSTTAGPAPAEPQQTASVPPETDPAAPMETEPVETDPAESKPAETEPVETELVETDPPETEPPVTEPPETEPPLPERTGFAEVPILLEEGCYLSCAAASDTEAGLLFFRWDDEGERYTLVFGALDPFTAECTGLIPLEEAPIEMPDVLEFDDERIVAINSYLEQAAVYDRSGALLELRDYPVMAPEHRGWQNRMVDDSFYREIDYASLYTYFNDEGAFYLGFYDDTDKVYVLDNSFDSLQTVREHTILLAGNLDDERGIQYRLADLETGQLIDTLSLPLPEDGDYRFINPNTAVIGRGWVMLCANLELDWEISDLGFWFWYPDQEAQEPFPVQALSSEDLDNRTLTLVNDLETRYPIRLLLDVAPDPDLVPTMGLEDRLEDDPDFRNECELGASPLKTYAILRQLDDFLGKLPEGFVAEIRNDVPGMEYWGSRQIDIYIVRNIPGDTAAFANCWVENMTVCFATEEFAASHLAHEFMHLIDYRLMCWCDAQRDRNLDGEWTDLSPSWGYDRSYDDWEEVNRYFVSSYARTNTMEDRAETFQLLFDWVGPVEEAWWYMDRPGVQEKVKYLIDVIRDAFPSVQAVDRAWWEKLPDDALAPAA